MIFFDNDGTLIDHKKAENMSINMFFIENAFYDETNGEDFIKQWKRITKMYFYQFLQGLITFEQQRIRRMQGVFEHYGRKLSDIQAQRKVDRFLKDYEDVVHEFDDVEEALKLLKGHELGIISNGDNNQQVFKLKKAGIIDLFKGIVVAGECGHAKPDKRIFEIACERANVDPTSCYYIGDDYDTDIIGCENVGMKGILIDRFNKYEDGIAKRVIRDLRHIDKFIK